MMVQMPKAEAFYKDKVKNVVLFLHVQLLGLNV